MQKKILGIVGSPRKAATYESLQVALEGARTFSPDDLNVELVSFKGKKIAPCNHCNACKRNGGRCVIEDDMTPLYESLLEADSFIFASPVYAMNMTPQLSAFFSRMRALHDRDGGKLRNKLATAIAVGGRRNGGQELTISNIVHACLTRGIVYVGGEPGFYSGAMVWSGDKGKDVLSFDEEAENSLLSLGRRLAYWTLLIAAGKSLVGAGEVQMSKYMF
ncbi:flavodoxin family protein [Sediminispirochaeta bajacaliforniensis]|uniref:flavodoxin family protein n=1 Tax=Sediminispirochaeta bajacaliforniensis TaxID=148 RepID=UPI00035FDE96|nr:flavodoxin family protein [Sediminispirochaeta bajacaliforniensis]